MRDLEHCANYIDIAARALQHAKDARSRHDELMPVDYSKALREALAALDRVNDELLMADLSHVLERAERGE